MKALLRYCTVNDNGPTDSDVGICDPQFDGTFWEGLGGCSNWRKCVTGKWTLRIQKSCSLSLNTCVCVCVSVRVCVSVSFCLPPSLFLVVVVSATAPAPFLPACCHDPHHGADEL